MGVSSYAVFGASWQNGIRDSMSRAEQKRGLRGVLQSRMAAFSHIARLMAGVSLREPLALRCATDICAGFWRIKAQSSARDLVKLDAFLGRSPRLVSASQTGLFEACRASKCSVH